MRNLILPLLLALSFTARAQPSVASLDAAALEKNKKRIAAADRSLLPAYRQLQKEADKALLEGPYSVMEKKNDPPSGDRHDYMSLAPYFWPDPSRPNGLPYIRKDGQTNPEVKEYKDKEYLPKLCEQVSTLGLAYYFSGKEDYAAHAAKLVRVWFLDTATRMNPNLNFGQAIKGVNTGRGAGLIDIRHFVKLLEGLRLIEGAKSWTSSDQKAMQQWMQQFLHWMQTSPIGRDEMEAQNNHGTWYDAVRMAINLYTGDTAGARIVAANAMKRLDAQMDEEGKFPKEMERTISLHYNVFDLEAFFLIAAMGDKIGLDLWKQATPKGHSLKKGFTFLHPYLTQQKTWTGQQIKPFPFEEGYPLLFAARRQFTCPDCVPAVETIAGKEAPKLRYWLLY